MEIKFEKAKENDINGLLKLENCVFGKESINSLKHALSVPSYYYLLAKYNDKIVGYIVLNLLKFEGEILSLAVDNDFRRRGIAKKLIDFGFNVFIKNNIYEVFLEVDEINKVAQTLYKSVGFEEIDIRKGYYNHKNGLTDAIIMKKTLNS